MLDLKTLKVNGKVRVVNNVDNNVGLRQCVNIGDVGIVKRIDSILNKVQVVSESWSCSIWYFPHQLENVTPSEDLIFYKSRWDEIIDNLEGGYGMTDEEVDIVKSVLKNNIPFNVVPDLRVVDIVIEKENQTHLDANYFGIQGDPCFYYRSYLLKQWFWWNHSKWKECEFDFNELLTELFNPVSFGESK